MSSAVEVNGQVKRAFPDDKKKAITKFITELENQAKEMFSLMSPLHELGLPSQTPREAHDALSRIQRLYERAKALKPPPRFALIYSHYLEAIGHMKNAAISMHEYIDNPTSDVFDKAIEETQKIDLCLKKFNEERMKWRRQN
jgi:hypothetical protein